MIPIDFPFVRQTLICRSFLILFRFVPSEEPAMVSFDKDGIFVDVSVPRFQQENLIARKKRNPIPSFLLEMVSSKNKR